MGNRQMLQEVDRNMAMVLVLGVGLAGRDKLLDVLCHKRPPEPLS